MQEPEVPPTHQHAAHEQDTARPSQARVNTWGGGAGRGSGAGRRGARERGTAARGAGAKTAGNDGVKRAGPVAGWRGAASCGAKPPSWAACQAYPKTSAFQVFVRRLAPGGDVN